MSRLPQLRVVLLLLTVFLALTWTAPHANASQCSPLQIFASIGNKSQGQPQVYVDVSATDADGNEIGRFWSAGDSMHGSSFQAGGNCPSNSTEGWWRSVPAGHRGIQGVLGDDGCQVSTCPLTGNDEMVFVVEDWGPFGPPGNNDTAYFIAFRVDGTPADLRAWNIGRVAPSTTVLPMTELPVPNVVGTSSAGGGAILLSMIYPAVEASVHSTTGGDATSVVKSFDLLRFVGPPGSADPGRQRTTWTLVDQQPYMGVDAASEVEVTCPPTGADIYLALGFTFHGGAGPDVPSALVGRPIQIECGGIGVTNPAGAVPDGHGVFGEPLRLDKSPGPGPLELQLTWGPSCRSTDIGYAIYEGMLGDFASHAPVDCSVSALSVWFQPAAGDAYYLVVPHSGPDVSMGTFPAEGSYGRNGKGAERQQNPLTGCAPQDLSTCE